MDIGDARKGTGLAGQIAIELKALEPKFKVDENKAWVLPDALAKAIITHLKSGTGPDVPEFAELDALATLIEVYEERRHPPIPPDPIEAIKFRLEQMQMTKKDLEPFIGGRARVSEILNRKRNLSLTMIANLHEHLNIPAEVLIRRTRADGYPRRLIGSD